MPTLDLTFEVFCDECGAGLCNNCAEGVTKGRGAPFISIKPCKVCAEAAFQEGYAEAQKEKEPVI